MSPIRRTFYTLIALALLPDNAGAQAPATQAPAPERETLWGKPVNGVQAGIRLADIATTVHIGNRVKVEMVMRNTTDHDIDYAYGNAQRIYGWQVKRQKDGVWEIAPRWRYWQELKLEGVVAGAVGLRLAAGSEMAVPMDGPEILISDRPPSKPDPSERQVKLSLTAKPGTDIQLRALPITAAARGEEWLDKLETGVLKLHVAARQAQAEPNASRDGVNWGPATNGIQAGLRLDPPRKSYRVGEPTWQEVYVRNRGTEPVSFIHSIGFEEQGQARILDDRGNPVHVQQYYGMGGMALSAPREARPGEIVQVGRHAVAFTGQKFGQDSPKEVAPGISGAADGMPRAYGPPGTYQLAQIASGSAGGKSISLVTGSASVTVTPNDAGGNMSPIALTDSSRSAILDLATAQIAWGREVNGIRAGLVSVDGKSHVLAGEKVRLAVVVQNVADHPVSFWHETSFIQPPATVVRDQAGHAIPVRESPETEWRPISEIRMTGVTFDMTYAPSAGGPGRTVESEIKPGQAVLGYLLTSIVLPENLPNGTSRLSIEQPWAVGFGAAGAIDKTLTTGPLNLDVVGAEQPGQSAADLTGVHWGQAEAGLQIGIRFSDAKAPHATGEQIWMDLYVRNDSKSPKTVTYRTGSIYIDPPIEVEGEKGQIQVTGGSGQIVAPRTITLQPGEAALIGHPNYILYPNVQREIRGLTVYPEMAVDSGSFRLRQRFPIEVDGRTIQLASGPLTLHLAPRKTQIAWGPVADGFRAGIGFQTDRDRYHVGETLGLVLYVENVTDEPKTLTWMTNGDPMQLECFGEAGGRVDVRRTFTTSPGTDNSVQIKPHERYMLNSPALKLSPEPAVPEWGSEVILARPGRYSLATFDITEFRSPSDPSRTPLRTGRLWLTILPRQ
jgi:hypothetical protein